MATKSHVAKLIAYSTVHGMHERPEYRVWKGMNRRCYSKRDQNYGDYGGRGITVCAEWRHDFARFFADIGPRPDGHTLERIDNNGPYELGNCRWATRAEQARNRRVRFNATGSTGVSFHRKTGKYAAVVCLAGGRRQHLGLFRTVEEAAAARVKYADPRDAKDDRL